MVYLTFGSQQRYKQDISLAIQLLQCKPDSFLPQKINSVRKLKKIDRRIKLISNLLKLPLEMQSKVATYMKLDSVSDSECSGIPSKAKYHILPTNDDEATLTACRFPSNSAISIQSLGETFKIYVLINYNSFCSDHNRNGDLKVSPTIVAKFLESELKSRDVKHCDTCACSSTDLIDLGGIHTMFTVTTQTDLSSLSCPRCNRNLNSPSTVVSESKSISSDFVNPNEKTPFSPAKKDDLMVNPILGHHRLCEHTKSFNTQSAIAKEDLTKAKEVMPTKISNGDVGVPKQKPVGDTKGEEKEVSDLTHGPGNGSNTSLWSKDSSKEGAKLFESFNRNLIKTMKVSLEF